MSSLVDLFFFQRDLFLKIVSFLVGAIFADGVAVIMVFFDGLILVVMMIA